MPQPALVRFLAHIGPHFIHLGCPSALHVYGNVVWVEGAQSRGVHRLKCCFFLLERMEPRVCADA
jgi:hypothetical protein